MKDLPPTAHHIDFTRFDGLETHPVQDILWDSATMGQRPFAVPDFPETCGEICEPHEAHFWALYGHLNEGGIESLQDFATEAEAHCFALKLLNAHPHLQKYGIL